jgi:hypothetical protein
LNLVYNFFHIRFEVMSYHYNKLCSHLGHLVIDLLVTKERISRNDSWRLSVLNMQKNFWVVSSCEYVNFAINGKYSQKIMTIQTIMLHCDLSNIQKLNFKGCLWNWVAHLIMFLPFGLVWNLKMFYKFFQC